MNRVTAKFVVFTALAIGMAGAIVAAEKFVIALPNGYQMVRARSGDPVITKRSGATVVPGPIKAFVVIREVVTGSMRTAETAAPAKSAEAAPAAVPAEAQGAAPLATPPPAAAAPAAGAPAAPGAAPAGAKPAAPPAQGSAPADKAASPVFPPPAPDPSARYFVLDTKTGEVSKDLSLADWQERLKKLDITAAPQLAEPILPK